MSDVLLAIPQAVSPLPSRSSVVPSSPQRPRSISPDTNKQREIARYHCVSAEFSPVAEGTIGTKYRFRAECARDADLFLRAISSFIVFSWTVTPLGFYPDVVVAFTLAKEISQRDLLWIASLIRDGHVLVQTLEKNSDYTGERDCDREINIEDPEITPSATVLAEMEKRVAWYVKSLKYLVTDAKEFAVSLKAISS